MATERDVAPIGDKSVDAAGGGWAPGFWRSFGPGLLWAATAIGVSHLVQATRAGATLGFGLTGVILLALILKYPFFEYGPRYAAATGMSLIEGYQRIGRWALWLYLAVILSIAVFTQGAILLFSSHLFLAAFGLEWSVTATTAGIYAICGVILIKGRFRALELTIKVMLAALALCTLFAAALVLPRADFSTISLAWPAAGTVTFGFLLALMGWMPSDIAASVYSSLWTLAKDQETGERASVRVARTDFMVAYGATTLLVFAFLIIGAAVMYGSGVEFSGEGAVFSMQLVDLYTATIGAWVRPVVIVLALVTMFSTALTVLDGFPRVIDRAVTLLRVGDPRKTIGREPGNPYWISFTILGLMVVSLLGFFRGGLTTMVDFATGLAFVMGPILGYLNLRAVTSEDMPEAFRPGPAMRAYSYVGLLLLGGIAVVFLVAQVTTIGG